MTNKSSELEPVDGRPVRVVVAGADGRMGRSMSSSLAREPGIAVVGGLRRRDTDVAQKLLGADVLLDFTHAESAPALLLAAIRAGVRPVSGTSGLSDDALASVDAEARRCGIGAMWIPNFSLGAVLMTQMARLGARYLSAVEIVEGHPAWKADAPSGTALALARAIRQEHGADLDDPPVQTSHLEGVRGAVEGGVRLHSVRHPTNTLISWHEVIFTGEDGVLTIRHDQTSSFSPVSAVAQAIRVVMRSDVVGLVRGYESVIGLTC